MSTGIFDPRSCFLCQKEGVLCDLARPCSQCKKRGTPHMCLGSELSVSNPLPATSRSSTSSSRTKSTVNKQSSTSRGQITNEPFQQSSNQAQNRNNHQIIDSSLSAPHSDHMLVSADKTAHTNHTHLDDSVYDVEPHLVSDMDSVQFSGTNSNLQQNLDQWYNDNNHNQANYELQELMAPSPPPSSYMNIEPKRMKKRSRPSNDSSDALSIGQYSHGVPTNVSTSDLLSRYDVHRANLELTHEVQRLRSDLNRVNNEVSLLKIQNETLNSQVMKMMEGMKTLGQIQHYMQQLSILPPPNNTKASNNSVSLLQTSSADFAPMAAFESAARMNQDQPIALFDISHNPPVVILANDAFCRLFGYSNQNQVINKPWVTFIHRPFLDRTAFLLQNTSQKYPAIKFAQVYVRNQSGEKPSEFVAIDVHRFYSIPKSRKLLDLVFIYPDSSVQTPTPNDKVFWPVSINDNDNPMDFFEGTSSAHPLSSHEAQDTDFSRPSLTASTGITLGGNVQDHQLYNESWNSSSSPPEEVSIHSKNTGTWKIQSVSSPKHNETTSKDSFGWTSSEPFYDQLPGPYVEDLHSNPNSAESSAVSTPVQGIPGSSSAAKTPNRGNGPTSPSNLNKFGRSSNQQDELSYPAGFGQSGDPINIPFYEENESIPQFMPLDLRASMDGSQFNEAQWHAHDPDSIPMSNDGSHYSHLYHDE